MPRFGVVARFYVELPVQDQEEAERVLRSKLQQMGCTHVTKEGAIQAMEVGQREPIPQSETKEQRRARYQRRREQREEARRRNGTQG